MEVQVAASRRCRPALGPQEGKNSEHATVVVRRVGEAELVEDPPDIGLDGLLAQEQPLAAFVRPAAIRLRTSRSLGLSTLSGSARSVQLTRRVTILGPTRHSPATTRWSAST